MPVWKCMGCEFETTDEYEADQHAQKHIVVPLEDYHNEIAEQEAHKVRRVMEKALGDLMGELGLKQYEVLGKMDTWLNS